MATIIGHVVYSGLRVVALRFGAGGLSGVRCEYLLAQICFLTPTFWYQGRWKFITRGCGIALVGGRLDTASE